MVISGDIDGIIHRHSLLLRGVRELVLFVLFVFTKSGVLYCTPITSYTFLPRHKKYSCDKKNTLVIHFCI